MKEYLLFLTIYLSPYTLKAIFYQSFSYVSQDEKKRKFMILSQFYNNNSWDVKAKITSANDNIIIRKGNLGLATGDEINILHIVRIDGDTSPSGIPNFVKK